ncbi:hypothetical protein [Salinicola aestuarinus]|uniref:hypothetical protein n=1 Tax=Salinicola aestuarinus TaxID=1949082 RepID=UPI000DA2514C|nr:hypothetical protein [Salinicola aestuarinus]
MPTATLPKTLNNRALLGFCLAASLAALTGATATTAAAAEGERLSGADIRQEVWGNRVQGAMASGQRYDEVYREDGTIEGDGYTGQATVVDDRMCFDYGDGEPTCYGVRRDGEASIEWLDGDEVVGEGELSDAD